MRPFATLAKQLGDLVHASADAETLARPRHAWFIGSRLGLGALGLASVPVLLAVMGGVRVPALIVILGVVLQAVAGVLASRTGRLGEAHLTSILAGVATLLGYAASGDGLASPALAGLPLLVLEAALIGRMREIRYASTLAFGALCALLLLQGGADPVAFYMHVAVLAFALGMAQLAQREMRSRMVRERRLAAHSRMLVDGFGDLVTRHDAQGSVFYAGPGAASVLACAPGALLGRGLFERVHVADRPLYLMALADAGAGSAFSRTQVRVRKGDGDRPAAPVYAWIELRARRVEADADAHEGEEIISVLRDISTQRQHEAEIDQARSAAEAAAALKDRFLATVSHELRTPLNAIIGFSEMLGDEKLVPAGDARQRDYARIIHVSGEHLLQVVNALLDMSKIDAGTLTLQPEPFDVDRLVAVVADMLRLKAEQAGIDFRVAVEPGLPELVADRRACKQILINLLSNAIKFTPAGGQIVLDVRRDGDILTMVVEDTGIGIAPDDLPRLGEPFFQARASYDRPYEGTGLGLSVVRGLVGLHAGAMRIDSAPGKGTRVTVRFGLDGRLKLSPLMATRPGASAGVVEPLPLREPSPAAIVTSAKLPHPPIDRVKKSA
ncbi:PAS domain-containing sensor histidine kinase [Alsobacter metallidurans]|uniref:histidine kinase n=1 Tax=Alsobacter metallidurans TaxID=340221 RepID=A0A917MGY1_9HYPH|nr:PAS domain-containing sensor histidine kinase [Alsobacter metallidurans]GGH13701.1 PAS domain-containing sensor histidine kinase [Alsobacter metallidurans]